MVNLCKSMFPDSAIAQAMSMKRTKCTDLTKALGTCISNELVSKLRINKFSVIIDETTDVSSTKCLTIFVKFFDQEAKLMKTGLLQLIDVYDENNEMVGSTGENLYNMIVNTLNAYNIPLDNLVGFAADGAANIMGGNNSISSRLREVFPGLTIFKCICHSIHLCASESVKHLPRHCEDLIRNIFTHFAHSAMRKYELKLAQTFLDLKPHKILHACTTRWLSLHAAVERVLEQWDALKLYFSRIEDQERLKSVEPIVRSLKDPSIFLWDLVDKANIVSFDPSLCTNHMPLNRVYLGSKVHGLLQLEEYNRDHEMVNDVRTRCREFLIRMCQQLKKRFDLDNKFFYMASFLDIKKVLQSKPRELLPTLHDFSMSVPRIYGGNLQDLDNEWRNLDSTFIPEEIKSCSITDFYVKLGGIKDNEGILMFNNLSQFALNVLSLPTTNTAAERLFSKLNLIKTDNRNKLLIPALQALTVISEKVRGEGCCYNFKPTQPMIECLGNFE
ncbi:zinc finger protein 862-like [Macrobrachium rosenbergii]|uniref:zinc finger protein 862-like n=1 Tax=Macrobrachium rosenbergii TaxID=79674 RepID=UPI0034D57B7F